MSIFIKNISFKKFILPFVLICSFSDCIAQEEDPFRGVLKKRRARPRNQVTRKSIIANPHMFEGGSSGVITVSNIKSQEDSTKDFSGSLGYYYQALDWVQIGAEASVYKTDSLTSYNFIPGVILNFFYDKSINTAFYIKGNIGISGVSYEDTSLEATSEIILFGEIGKRFALAQNITWSPSISSNYLPDQEDYDPSLSINLLKFNLFF